MPRVTQSNSGVYEIGTQRSRGALFDLSSPAGWTMIWWSLSILIILLIWFSL